MAVHGGFVDGPAATGGFHEEDHPRDAKGEFAEKGGSKDAGQNGAAGAFSPSSGKGNPLATLARPGFRMASDAERKSLKIPPAWTDVHIANDPDASLVAVGRDTKGRQQSRYSAAHTAAALIAKHERGRMLNAALPSILYHLGQEINEGGKGSEEASVLRLIAQTGARIGGEGDTGAEVQAYGASTLEARHVTINDGVAVLDFVGKLGVRNVYHVTDSDTVADLEARLDAAPDGDAKLFKTSDTKVRAHLKKAAGGQGFKVHDLRTWKATVTARAAMQSTDPPRNAQEYWAKRDAVGMQAAKQINDTPEVALGTYVDPIIFEDWRTTAGVGATDERPKGKRKDAKPAEGQPNDGGATRSND